MTTDSWHDEERQSYESVWRHQFYRAQADGDPVVRTAFKQMRCQPGESLIDWGCGRGTPAYTFRSLGLKVTGFDIAHNCLNPEVDIPLVVGCIWDELPPDLYADYAFCTDVLEHLPPAKLDRALDNIRARTRKAAFFQVCTVLDTAGKQMSPPMRLHLSVMPPEEWRALIAARWQLVSWTLRGKARASYVCNV